MTSGIYTICITDSTGCNICFADTILEDPTSIQKTDFGDISIYPNPSNGKIVVVINSIFPEKEILISIISSTGKKIRSEKIVSGVNNLNYSDLANGIYFLQVEGSEDIVRRKIVLLK
ncbi:MAG: T9SS type A sorting domain-containing protein [Bacteroidetes bacterium]|nr:T9SS type A sorting domain-containing protein [Bacteroidota bacterium]